MVLTAAGLSGLAQAVYLADGVRTTPALLRFGIGAWPAIAAAVVAHLLYLLATHTRPAADPAASVQPERLDTSAPDDRLDAAVQPSAENRRHPS